MHTSAFHEMIYNPINFFKRNYEIYDIFLVILPFYGLKREINIAALRQSGMWVTKSI